MYRIMIVEDEIIMRNELSNMLKNNGYEVCNITDFVNVADQLIQEHMDLILLDINLPNENGYQICSKVRASIPVPIIFITSRNSDMDELNSFISGGDDYITKPYNIPVLLARISNVLKRTYKESENEQLEYKGLILYVEKNIIVYNEQEIELTKNEFKILLFLVKGKGKILSRTEIIEYLWDNEMFVDDNTLSVNIRRIRAKLEKIGLSDFIHTMRYNQMNEYLKENKIYIFVGMTALIFLSAFLISEDIQTVYVISIDVISWGIFSFLFVYHYLRRKKYHTIIEKLLEGLDKKYLLTDIIEFSQTLEDQFYYQIMKECTKAMLDEIAREKIDRLEYKEYIEQWLHEIKNPLATIKLICDNDRSATTTKILLEITRMNNYMDQVLYYARSAAFRMCEESFNQK